MSNQLRAIRLGMELVKYLVNNQISQISLDFSFLPDIFTVTVRGQAAAVPADWLQVAEALQAPRQPEIDEYYEQLIGMDMRDQDLRLLGAMVDYAETRYEDGMIVMTISRTSN